jgi:hypothetical protein
MVLAVDVPMKSQPLSLSDRQLEFIRRGAAALPVQDRDAFLKAVAARLRGEPSDSAVSQAVNGTLGALATTFKL